MLDWNGSLIKSAIADLAFAGKVHDIGKVGLPAGLLEKPGPLTLEERRLMEAHSTIGERILANVDGYQEIAQIVRHHHESWDGSGYPDKIKGTDIPIGARILSVVDCFDALTSDRPYRPREFGSLLSGWRDPGHRQPG